jgi:hypothetical protein
MSSIEVKYLKHISARKTFFISFSSSTWECSSAQALLVDITLRGSYFPDPYSLPSYSLFCSGVHLSTFVGTTSQRGDFQLLSRCSWVGSSTPSQLGSFTVGGRESTCQPCFIFGLISLPAWLSLG